jgi:hypothetical protein
MDNYLLRAPDQAIDTMWVGLARAAPPNGNAAVAEKVAFRRRAPALKERAEYERVFACPLVFDAVGWEGAGGVSASGLSRDAGGPRTPDRNGPLEHVGQ